MLYILKYKPILSIRQMVFYLGKLGIVPDSIITQGAQTVDRPSPVFWWRKCKPLQPKVFLDQYAGYFVLILEKTDTTNTLVILLMCDNMGRQEYVQWTIFYSGKSRKRNTSEIIITNKQNLCRLFYSRNIIG